MEIMKKNRYRSLIELVLVSLASSIVGGCASAVDIEANFPPPLIQPLPVRVGLIYDEQFVRYEYSTLPEPLSCDYFLPYLLQCSVATHQHFR